MLPLQVLPDETGKLAVRLGGNCCEWKLSMKITEMGISSLTLPKPGKTECQQVCKKGETRPYLLQRGCVGIEHNLAQNGVQNRALVWEMTANGSRATKQ